MNETIQMNGTIQMNHVSPPDSNTDWVPIRTIPLLPRAAHGMAKQLGLNLKKIGRDLWIDRHALQRAIQTL